MLTDPIHLTLFRGYGTTERLLLWGRALGNAPDVAAEGASLLQNLAAMYNRIDSNELPGLTVRASLRGEEWETTSDQRAWRWRCCSRTPTAAQRCDPSRCG